MKTNNNVIRETVAKLFVPFIQLYGLYVIVHGDSGPGGGFQGGVILGASVILYAMVFGLDSARQRISAGVREFLNSAGVLVYAGVGLLCVFFGGNFLDYRVLPLGEPHFASHIGIFAIEVGVGITVAGVMVTIFFEAADRVGGTKKGGRDG